MTEQEAKKKMCPVGGMRGSYDGNWDKGYCIGSACMAWRWLPRPDRVHACGGGGQGRFGIEPIPGTVGADVPETEVHTSWQQTIPNTEPPRGYCGLAGKP